MSVTAIVGAQWGDEGKGRIVDYLAQKADMVIRFQGGDNAGHTVINDKGKFALHIVPSGIFNPETICIIGAGTVVSFESVEAELLAVQKAGVQTDNLFIDRRAHLILPFHRLLDGAQEESKKGNWAVGTTKKGIGPCYSDKASRSGIRVGDLLDQKRLLERLQMLLPQKNRELAYYGLPEVDIDELLALCTQWQQTFAHRIIDTLPLVKKAVLSNKKVLLEGQLGVMRDLDWGIYPYTTSSNPSSGGACSGSGIAPRHIKYVIGVVKAYSTSVGGGPFPTELFGPEADKLRSIGKEFGATTGRPRRCGWFDAVAAAYSCWINGFSHIAITKLDVLDSFETLKICTAYELDGKIITDVPDTADQQRVKCIYEEMEGWQSDTTSARTWDELPSQAQAYLTRIAQLTGSPMSFVSVGPERDQIIIMGEENEYAN
ncbi:MAG: adenylosuccinate synthase [Sphaerochaetaceae bacterium]